MTRAETEAWPCRATRESGEREGERTWPIPGATDTFGKELARTELGEPGATSSVEEGKEGLIWQWEQPGQQQSVRVPVSTGTITFHASTQ